MLHKNARRILVYRTGQIGDTIIALPAMRAVRNSFPSAHLCLLTGRHQQSNFVLAADVLPQEGLFDDCITYPTDTSGANPKVFPAMLREIRRQSFDTLVYLAPRIRTRWQVRRDLLFFRMAGIRNFIGHRGVNPMQSPGDDNPLPEVEHEADHLLERLSLSGIPVPSPDKRSIDLQLTEKEHRQATDWLRNCLGEQLIRMPLIAVGPGSKSPSKMWPEERFADLGKHLINESGLYPIIFGGPEDRDLGQRLISIWGSGANACGELSVRQAAAAMTNCCLYIGNDTGTMHLAAAAGVTCVAIFSAIDWPGRWYPYGIGHTVLRRSVPCEGCQLQICVERELICLQQIAVADVLAVVKRKLIEPIPLRLATH
jgi:heptosyltransferase III